jgi:hypothetical protein
MEEPPLPFSFGSRRAERRRVICPTVLVLVGEDTRVGRTSSCSIRVIFARQDYMLVT